MRSSPLVALLLLSAAAWADATVPGPSPTSVPIEHELGCRDPIRASLHAALLRFCHAHERDAWREDCAIAKAAFRACDVQGDPERLDPRSDASRAEYLDPPWLGRGEVTGSLELHWNCCVSMWLAIAFSRTRHGRQVLWIRHGEVDEP
jgi:hypothetical protein